MKKIQIALYHCPNSMEYKLIRLTDDIDLNDPCLMWIFDSSKIRLAKKIARNLNLVQDLNPATNFPIIT